MDDEQLVVVAEHLWPHEAGMMQGLLEMAGVQAYVRGGLSTGSDIPGPASAITVAAVNQARAGEILAGVDASAEAFVCAQCGETSPPGFSECPMCAVLEEPVKPTVASKGISAIRVVIVCLLLALGVYVYIRGPT